MTTRSGRITTAALGALAASALLIGAAGVRTPAFAQGRTTYDFEDGTTQGFLALAFKDGQIAEDTGAKLAQVKAKEQAKSGEGALAYTYKLEKGTIRFATLPTKLGADTKSIRFWAKSTTGTTLALILREPDDSRYAVRAFVPASEWTPVVVNVDEFALEAGTQDENSKLDIEQVDSLTLFDFAWTYLANDATAKAVPNAAGERLLLIDNLQLSPEAAPQSTGSYKAGDKEYHIVDNFDSGTIHWTPVRVNFNEKPPVVELFPSDAPVKILTEAAAPGDAKTPIDAGGKGIRFSYKRTAGQAYALVHSLADRNLKGVTNLKLNLRVTHKALMIIELKEKDGSKFQQNLYPDDNKNWRSLSYPLDTLVQADDSTDENDKLDVDQLQEISIIDSSPMMAESTPPGEVTIEVDSVVFQLK